MSRYGDDPRSRARGRDDYDYDDDRRDGSRTRISETERRRIALGRASSPPPRDDDRRRYEYEQTVSRVHRDDRERDRSSKYRDDDSPERKPKYSIPGDFREEEKETRVRYSSKGEKEYYEERKSKSKYSRDDSPSPPPKSRYVTQDTYKYTKETRDRDHDRDRDRDYKKYQKSDSDSDSDRHKKHEAKFSVGTSKHKFAAGVELSHDGRRSRSRSRSNSPPHKTTTLVTTTGRSSYAEPKQWEYAKPDSTISYSRKESFQSSVPSGQIVTVEPGRRASGGASLGARMGSLSVGRAMGGSMSLAAAPGSPLLEAYRGTYQTIGSMPSPMMIASGPHSEVAVLDIGPAGSKKRHARFHDPAADAAALAKALKGSKSPDVGPLIEILPALTQEQVLQLRVEYKKLVKTGSERKGVNIAKHIKLRLKDEDSSLMKACYAVALGQWESEAFWANSYYQGEKSRRELLIESLMGRTNAEIRAIKDGFSDKKYSDSLTKCMKTELKEDKFKKAVLLVLEERRMEEPRIGLDRRQVEEDVKELYKALRSEKGGETAMIQIIVLRSDGHLREVLRVYELSFKENFARAMLKKSGNLVGEMLAHILNGVINRPVRDALLLNHALSLSATKSDEKALRKELLTSRLVRYHWERNHMEAIKREYRARYGQDLQVAVAEGTKGEWGEFMEELCVRRMPDDVRRVERVEMVQGFPGRG